MAKDLTLNVVVRKDDKALAEMAVEFEALSKEAEASGKKINTTFKQQVDTKLKDTERQLKSLKAEFAKSGDIALVGQIRTLEKELRNLGKAQKSLLPSIGGGGAGAEGLLPKLLQFGAPAAPLAAAVGGSAILGALGIGIIGAGIAGQLHSPQVQQALTQFKTDAGATFTDATSPFGRVLVQGLSDADATLRKVAPDLKDMFAAAAPAAQKLFDGIDGFVEKSIPGLKKGLDGANVVITELGRDLPAVGKAIGDAFAAAAVGAQGDAHALHDLLTVVDQLITATGGLAGDSGRLYEQLRSIATLNFHAPELSGQNLQKTFNALTTGGIEPLLEHLLHLDNKNKDAATSADGLARHLADAAIAAQHAAPNFSTLAASLSKTTDTADTLAGAMTDKVLGSLLASDHATLSFDESLTNLSDSFAQNGKQLDVHTKAGQANREAVLSAVEANLRIYDAQIQAGISAKDAAAAYDANTQSLRNQLRQAGLTKDQIDGLIGKYAQVPDKVNTNIALEGLTDAINNLTILTGAINGIPKYVKIEAAIEAVDKSGLAQNLPHDVHRAAGGPVMAGQPYIVGEQRPELFVPNVNGTIIPKLPGPMSYATGGAGRSSGQPTVSVAADNSAVAAALAPVVAYMLRVGAVRLSVSNGAVVAA